MACFAIAHFAYNLFWLELDRDMLILLTSLDIVVWLLVVGTDYHFCQVLESYALSILTPANDEENQTSKSSRASSSVESQISTRHNLRGKKKKKNSDISHMIDPHREAIQVRKGR